jgi:hypothetical protein
MRGLTILLIAFTVPMAICRVAGHGVTCDTSAPLFHLWAVVATMAIIIALYREV